MEDKEQARVDGCEWYCNECEAAGKYSEIHRGGVDLCPECRSPIEDIEE